MSTSALSQGSSGRVGAYRIALLEALLEAAHGTAHGCTCPQAKTGKVPGLAVVLVGGRKDSETYVRSKKKACEEAGIVSFGTDLPEDVSENELLQVRSAQWERDWMRVCVSACRTKARAQNRWCTMRARIHSAAVVNSASRSLSWTGMGRASSAIEMRAVEYLGFAVRNKRWAAPAGIGMPLTPRQGLDVTCAHNRLCARTMRTRR